MEAMSNSDGQNTEGTPPVDGSPPSNKDGEKDGGNGVPKYTEEEVQAKFRGQGKQLEEKDARIKELEEKEAARERQRQEEAGEYKSIAEQEAKARKEAEEKLAGLQEKELTRLQRVTESNEKRVKDLPKQFRDLIPPSLSADELSDHLSKLEGIQQGNVISVNAGSGRTSKTTTEEETEKKRQEEIQKAFLGGKKS
jgi:hypothetical protein